MSFPTGKKGNADGYEMVRTAMTERLRDHYHIADKALLEVMNRLPRHAFVPEALKAQAYKDNALPIAGGQTISQPFIVARMTELLELKGTEKILEIGAGTGYQTAILASLARKVFAIERLANLATEAERRLRELGFRNVTIKAADGTAGWDLYHPYDAMLVAAGGPAIPDPLVRQLKVGGRLIIPIGDSQRAQNLIRVTRTATGYTQENFGPCAFVPLIGEHGWSEVAK
ncbi:MAG TPA: protein-L-isoaspartate(D-aspartate) O-methyltransferase [Pyrinomonadaceae bacterium]|nr:protein-L-isoaspartate(D-aspartate) O-methyltransferase [Pyrinomonadaceae bacterium]HQX55625.1 protein-L-isoaspartate(D-aspartate) O-methyltransferase [Pyrinomonadaceae bacterium]HQY66285.1 protein-L-isoaspartate(D-aspartate) O-methyltransferase [Pyrinomonadaceae bacterium]HRA39062.1 protein-L-isoaspartate(D-aspartate) O-methyltransferase [Pyrinomonadaceae bacterium]